MPGGKGFLLMATTGPSHQDLMTLIYPAILPESRDSGQLGLLSMSLTCTWWLGLAHRLSERSCVSVKLGPDWLVVRFKGKAQ